MFEDTNKKKAVGSTNQTTGQTSANDKKKKGEKKTGTETVIKKGGKWKE